MCEAHESFTHPHRAPFSSSGGGGTELVTLTATSFFVYPSLNSKTILYHPLIILASAVWTMSSHDWRAMRVRELGEDAYVGA